jgi:predicted dehydrogenase
MKTKARLAIIGTGGLAQSQHIPNMFTIDNADLVAICDLRKDVVDSIGDQYGIERRETDHRKLLDDPEIDGVLIATREDTHQPLTLEALASGKHVYVEKPLAETEEACAEVTSAQQAAGKIVAVGMNRRMAPAYCYAKKLLWNQGGPQNMFYRIADSYSLDWGKPFGPGKRIVHEICHIFDILRYFADSEVSSVYCVSSRPDDELINLQFASGTVATIMGSGYVNSDMPKEHFEAIAETGSLTVDDFAEVRQYSLDPDSPTDRKFAGHSHPQHDLLHQYLLEELGDTGMRAVRRVSLKALTQIKKLEASGNTDGAEYRQLQAFARRMPLRNYFMDKGWRSAIEDFAAAILAQRDFAGASAFDGLQAARITQAAIQSRTTGQVVSLTPPGV